MTGCLRQGRETTHSDSCSQALFGQSEPCRSSQEDVRDTEGQCALRREEVPQTWIRQRPLQEEAAHRGGLEKGGGRRRGGGKEAQTVISGKMLAWLTPGEETVTMRFHCSSEPDTHCGRGGGRQPHTCWWEGSGVPPLPQICCMGRAARAPPWVQK